MTKEEKAKSIVQKITSWAPWEDWNGVPRSVIESIIADGISEYEKQQGLLLMQWIIDTNWAEKDTWGKHDPPSIPTHLQLYDLFLKQQS